MLDRLIHNATLPGGRSGVGVDVVGGIPHFERTMADVRAA